MAPILVRGAVFGGAGRPIMLETLHLDDPAEGELRVRMVASGVCHSDLHVVDGEWARPANVVLGHEGAAIVEALGPGVPERPLGAALADGGFRVGDLVVLAWTAPCGACVACRRGEAWLCLDPRGNGHRLDANAVRLRRSDGTPIGVYSGIGTFCTAQVVAAEAAVPVDPRTPPEIAALIGCAVTTGVGAVTNTAAVQAGESVLVIGAGGVGLAAIMAAADIGASPLIAVDREPAKRELARRAGASDAASPAQALEIVRRLTGRGVDHAFEAIGLLESVALAMDATRPGGTTTLIGMPPQADRLPLDVYQFVERGSRLVGSNYGSAVPARDFPRIASAYLEGRLPLELMVTSRVGLDDLDDALAAMRRRDGARRVVVFDTA
jgi:S-(hydroxymethyl)glutathione dehydrogenase/alcohol dehydrogenase